VLVGRAWGRSLLLTATVALAACGEDELPAAASTQVSNATVPAVVLTTPVPPSTSTALSSTAATVTAAPPQLVIERRPATDEELRRLYDHELDCDHVGGYNWDYEATTERDPKGRTANDALDDAITEINDDTRAELGESETYEYVPTSGWVELISGDSSYFVHADDAWRFVIAVGGDADTGVWRHHSATLCQPAGYVPPTDPSTIPPATRPPYVETTVV
jgi:hypothetical protein